MQHKILSPSRYIKKLGPTGWAQLAMGLYIHQQYMGRLSCINIHKQARLGASYIYIYIFVTIKKKKKKRKEVQHGIIH